MLTNRAAAWLLIGGRLKPGVTEQRAAAEMDVIGKALAAEYPEQNRDTGLSLVGLSPIPGNVGTVGMFLALLLGLWTMFQRWRHPVPGYDQITRGRRFGIAAGYFGLAAALIATLPLGEALVKKSPFGG